MHSFYTIPPKLKCLCPLVLSQILWLSSITPRRFRNIDCQIKKNTCGHIFISSSILQFEWWCSSQPWLRRGQWWGCPPPRPDPGHPSLRRPEVSKTLSLILVTFVNHDGSADDTRVSTELDQMVLNPNNGNILLTDGNVSEVANMSILQDRVVLKF